VIYLSSPFDPAPARSPGGGTGEVVSPSFSSKNKKNSSEYGPVYIEDMPLPWRDDAEFQRFYSLVPSHATLSVFSYWHLYLLAKQSLNVPGDFVECGVYKGASASFIARVMGESDKWLRLYDTFEGMPVTDPVRDPFHREGEFADIDLYEVTKLVGRDHRVQYMKGRMPDTFTTDYPIAFAHIDVDIYQSTLDCCEFLYPRMSVGGVMLFDDYGNRRCSGLRMAADEYFADKPSRPIPLYSNQAMVVKV
jgi:O-methyltransferase